MKIFRSIRILLLLIIFIVVAFYSKSQKLTSRSWAEPLEVIIFPIDGDNSEQIKNYISNLSDEDFTDIDRFFADESKHFDIDTDTPIITRLGPVLEASPPRSPAPGSNTAAIIWWGIQFRIWAIFNTPDEQSNHRRVRIFLHYHESIEGRKLQHSLGLDKGLLAIVHGFAAKEQNDQNNIVIAHELLHTVGAIDKYDHNSEPIYPDGYANPDLKPLYPQSYAEIMSARIPISVNESRMAKNLEECIIGYQTAQEINWVNSEPENNL